MSERLCESCGVRLAGPEVGGLCAHCLSKPAPEPSGLASAKLARISDSGDHKLVDDIACRGTEVSVHPTAARFTTTLWTQVLAAPHDEKALASLCQKYWYPLYAFLRRSGVSSHEAEDLTQGFFFHLLNKPGLERVRREYGRFRSFLLASLRHFAADQRDRASAAKRSPGQPLIELDAQKAEDRYRLEPVEPTNPETIFERRWALTILEEALAALESEMRTTDRGEIFTQFQPFLCGEENNPGYKNVAARLCLSEASARVVVHRLRKRYGELVRREIAATLAEGEDLEDEMRHLFAVLRKT